MYFFLGWICSRSRQKGIHSSWCPRKRCCCSWCRKKGCGKNLLEHFFCQITASFLCTLRFDKIFFSYFRPSYKTKELFKRSVFSITMLWWPLLVLPPMLESSSKGLVRYVEFRVCQLKFRGVNNISVIEFQTWWSYYFSYLLPDDFWNIKFNLKIRYWPLD